MKNEYYGRKVSHLLKAKFYILKEESERFQDHFRLWKAQILTLDSQLYQATRVTVFHYIFTLSCFKNELKWNK